MVGSNEGYGTNLSSLNSGKNDFSNATEVKVLTFGAKKDVHRRSLPSIYFILDILECPVNQKNSISLLALACFPLF